VAEDHDPAVRCGRDGREHRGDRFAAGLQGEEVAFVARHVAGPDAPELGRELWNVDPTHVGELLAAERVVLEEMLPPVAQVDRGAHAVAHERKTAVPREPAQVVGTDDGVATGCASVAGGEAA
jgi:hypothetical protein